MEARYSPIQQCVPLPVKSTPSRTYVFLRPLRPDNLQLFLRTPADCNNDTETPAKIPTRQQQQQQQHYVGIDEENGGLGKHEQ